MQTLPDEEISSLLWKGLAFAGPVKEINEFELSTRTLRVISATDCVKDRLLVCVLFLQRPARITSSNLGD
jgi:hypothetical protein